MSAATGAAPVNDISIGVPLWAGPVFALVAGASLWATFGADRVLIALLPWAAVLGIISAIDLRELRVPNKIIGPAVLLAVPLLLAVGAAGSEALSLQRAGQGAVASLVLFGAFHLASPTSLGMGDVKLAPYIGAHLALFSWRLWYQGLLYGFVCVSVAGIVAIVVARTGRRSALPFAPFLTLGALIALIT